MLLMLVVLLSNLFSASRGYAREDSCPVPHTDNFFADFADPQECRMLRKFSRIAARKDDQLVVNMIGAQKAKAYRDSPESCWETSNQCMDYRLHSVDDCSQVVAITVGKWEDIDGLLLDRSSGQELAVDDAAYVSPDSSLWAVVGTDESSLQVIGRQQGRFVTVATGHHDYCEFEAWDTLRSFLVRCGWGNEYRETLEDGGRLSETTTGKVVQSYDAWQAAAHAAPQSCPQS
jgi:hypothetical protein